MTTKRRNSIRTALATVLAVALLAAGCDNVMGPGVSARPGGADGITEDIWAIRCATFRGPDRFDQADNCAQHLNHVAGLKRNLIRVVHQDAESAVYYGRYEREYNAQRDADRYRPDPQRDLDLIRDLSLMTADPQTGRRPIWPFRLATLDTLPTVRQSSAEWDLTGAPGYYSLQVAVFYNTENLRQRKTAAEEYCRLLREQGEEAHYHHGPVHSSVFIGVFPEGALQITEEPDRMTGSVHVRQRIADQRMLDLQRRYPHNLHNGHTFYDVTYDPATGEKIRDAHQSFPVRIPSGASDQLFEP